MTEIITSLQEYIKPELFVLVPLMFGLGAGMFLAAMYVMATAQLDGWQSVVMAVFTAIVQGGLCALASVGVHQVYKQAKEKKSEQ